MKSNPYRDLLSISDLYFEDLLNIPDDELLAEGEHNVSFAKEAYKVALQSTGKQRLLNAKNAYKVHTSSASSFDVTKMSPQEARNLLNKVANNPLSTLAARNLQHITDAEVMDMLANISNLGGFDE